MAMIDRLKERFPSTLTDPELQRLIDAANQEVVDRYGPHADPTQPITITERGGGRFLSIMRPIDSTNPIVVTEWVGAGWTVEQSTILVASDYRIWHNGRSLERLLTGTNPQYRWGHRVTVTYTPKNDGDQRQEVIIQIAALALAVGGTNAAEGIRQLTVGDVTTIWNDAAFTEQRECLLQSLAPRKGLLMA